MRIEGNVTSPTDDRARGSLTLEVIVVAAVMAVISVAIGEMTVALVRFDAREQAIAETQRRAAAAIESVREAAKGADSVVTGQAIDGHLYYSGTSTVAFSLPATDSGGALISGHDYIGFRRDSSDQTLLVEDIQAATGSSRRTGSYTIASFVREFRLGYNTSTPTDANLVQVYLETGETLGNATTRFPLSTWVLLENR